MKKKIVVLIVIFILLLIFICIFSVKFYKVNKIINLIYKNNQKTNYTYDINAVNNDFSFNIKRNKNLVLQILNIDYNIHIYYDFDKNVIYNIDSTTNTCYKRKIESIDRYLQKFPLYRYLTDDYSFINKLKLVFEWKIKDYDKDKYEITTKDNYKVIFDKNTGYVLKVTNIGNEQKVKFTLENFKENCVTDEEVMIPDLSEYKEIE